MKSFLRLLIFRIFCLFPSTRAYRFRAAVWRLVGINIHKTARVAGCVRFLVGDVRIGENTFVGHECLITGGKIEIGQNCDIGPRVIIHAGSHAVGPAEHRAGPCFQGTIIIGGGVWIGTGAIILTNVKIGSGAIVAAGSVITKDVPENMLAAGVPAVVKKPLNESICV